jgi:hypothetical protein
MIWILWIAFINVEVILHWYIIEVKEKDPTPDGKASINHLFVITSRLIVFTLLYYFLGVREHAEFITFLLGGLFTHLLIFPIGLNMARGLRPHYLGNGFTDKILGVLPFIARVWFLLVLSVGMIYAYYNTDLL